ncbi:MAG: flagellar hook-basal body complex protein, partial [Pseudomonadota bacterium]|nr:flagellar hook-basal body complex protein [Pseudomonadota bacterium]
MNYDVQEIAVSCHQAMRRMDAVVNNIANSGTPGFKQEYLVFLEDPAKGRTGPAANYPTTVESVEIDFRPGMVTRTGNIFDLALNGEGFFSIQTAEGVVYTRKGDFTLDRDGYLVTQSGDKVLGDGGALQISGQVVNFENDGSV